MRLPSHLAPDPLMGTLLGSKPCSVQFAMPLSQREAPHCGSPQRRCAAPPSRRPRNALLTARHINPVTPHH